MPSDSEHEQSSRSVSHKSKRKIVDDSSDNEEGNFGLQPEKLEAKLIDEQALNKEEKQPIFINHYTKRQCSVFDSLKQHERDKFSLFRHTFGKQESKQSGGVQAGGVVDQVSFVVSDETLVHFVPIPGKQEAKNGRPGHPALVLDGQNPRRPAR